MRHILARYAHSDRGRAEPATEPRPFSPPRTALLARPRIARPALASDAATPPRSRRTSARPLPSATARRLAGSACANDSERRATRGRAGLPAALWGGLKGRGGLREPGRSKHGSGATARSEPRDRSAPRAFWLSSVLCPVSESAPGGFLDVTVSSVLFQESRRNDERLGGRSPLPSPTTRPWNSSSRRSTTRPSGSPIY